MTDVLLPIQRQCGSCQVCCQEIEIPILQKPAFTRCQFQGTDRGCTIYGQHPKPCQVYRCGWLNGYGPEELRPDLSHLLIEVSQIESPDRQPLCTLLQVMPTKKLEFDDIVRRIEPLVSAGCAAIIVDEYNQQLAPVCAKGDEQLVVDTLGAFFNGDTPMTFADGEQVYLP